MTYLKLALIAVLIGIVYFAGSLGKRLDEMNNRIIETHKMTLELKDKIEKLEKEKINDHSAS